MCGIVGYVGKNQAKPILLESLKKLEYRGYDSSGITIQNKEKMKTIKCKGRINNLEKRWESETFSGTVGIGHTRWATHGEPSDINSHPHLSSQGKISIVHNGIIENYQYLKTYLIKKGYTFSSETDTEVIPNLIDYYNTGGNLLAAVIKAVSKIEGSFAVGVLSSDNPNTMLAFKKDSPLIVGSSDEGNFIASDVSALISYTRNVYYMNDNDFAVITPNNIDFYNTDMELIEKNPEKITWSIDAAEKCGYEHFMLKEIHEQPKAIKDTLAGRIMVDKNVSLNNFSLTNEFIKNIDRIYIVACGTAYHAGMVGKTYIEKLVGIPVEVDIASEFRYRDPIITDKTLLIVISQSGETADTLAALKEGKNKGGRVIAITNVVGSTVSREADYVLYTCAGPEIAVASTKAYTTQLISLMMIALYLAEVAESSDDDTISEIKKELLLLPEKVEKILKGKEALQKFASLTYNHQNMFYLGRGLDYAVAMEGSLKLKEISYIHTESYAAGELKHGTIALIEEGTVVIALSTQKKLREKMISNIREVTTRGANVLAFINDDCENIKDIANYSFVIPEAIDILTPILSVIPLQLFSYYVALQRGCDVDKPRNLAKSVTVE